jgi:hypothetical protein
MRMPQIEEMVKEALSKPEDFAWFGDAKYFVTWGLCGPTLVENSGDTLNQSNFEVIRDDLKERFPEDVEEIPQNHWAVGPITQLGIRVLDDDGETTECFKALLEWRENLEAYPVADDEHYSELEAKELSGYIDDVTGLALKEDEELRDDLPDNWIGLMQEKLFDEHSVSRVEDISDDKILGDTARELGFVVSTHPKGVLG